MSNKIIYAITIVLVLIAFYKDKKKAKKSLKKAWKAFENILPQYLGVIFAIGLVLAYLDAEKISRILGEASGWWGVLLAALIGTITLMPGFVAMPTAALLLENGAGYMHIAAFITTLMMVGIITIPIEREFFGKKVTFLRNGISFAYAFLVAFIIGRVVF